MANMLIRRLDDTLHARLKARAQQHGRSLEEEVRETLRLALARDASAQEAPSLMRIATGVFGPDRGIELELPARSLDLDRLPFDLGEPEREP